MTKRSLEPTIVNVYHDNPIGEWDVHFGSKRGADTTIIQCLFCGLPGDLWIYRILTRDMGIDTTVEYTPIYVFGFVSRTAYRLSRFVLNSKTFNPPYIFIGQSGRIKRERFNLVDALRFTVQRGVYNYNITYLFWVLWLNPAHTVELFSNMSDQHISRIVDRLICVDHKLTLESHADHPGWNQLNTLMHAIYKYSKDHPKKWPCRVLNLACDNENLHYLEKWSDTILLKENLFTLKVNSIKKYKPKVLEWILKKYGFGATLPEALEKIVRTNYIDCNIQSVLLNILEKYNKPLL